MCAYSFPCNTVGVGDVVPAGANGEIGSGDKLSQAGKIAKKKEAKTFSYSEPLPTVVYLKNN